MYRAKLGASSFAVYDPDLDEDGNLWRLGEELRVAVEEGALRVALPTAARSPHR
jgi:hypothetical protein